MNNIIKKLFYFNSKSVYNTNMIGKASRGSTTSSYRSGNQGVIMSQTAKVLRHLLKGNTVTAAEIQGKFGLANPTEAIRQLRIKGYAVYGNKTKLWDGTPTTKYRIGRPSRKMVALAYSVSGADLF
jgi:hypothetical protein